MDKYLERLQHILTSAQAGLTLEDMAYQPPGKWSAANVLEHLYLTYTGTSKGFERCLKAETPLARKPSVKDRVAAAYVLWLNYIPEGRQAPAPTRPQGMDARTLVEGIGPQIKSMGTLIAACEAKFGEKKKLLDHPFLGPLTGAEWRKFHFLHGRHHARQITGLALVCRERAKEKPTENPQA